MELGWNKNLEKKMVFFIPTKCYFLTIFRKFFGYLIYKAPQTESNIAKCCGRLPLHDKYRKALSKIFFLKDLGVFLSNKCFIENHIFSKITLKLAWAQKITTDSWISHMKNHFPHTGGLEFRLNQTLSVYKHMCIGAVDLKFKFRFF